MTSLSTLPAWITLDGAKGDLDRVLPELRAYAGLALRWRDIAAEVWRLGEGAPVDDPVKLAVYLGAAMDNAPVGEIFEKLGLEGLLNDLKAVRDRLGDVQSPWGKLLRPMSAFVPAAPGGTAAGADSFGIDDGGRDGLLALKIPKLATDLADGRGDAALTFSIAAEAGLGCAAGANWPFQRDEVAPGLLRIGGGGTVRTKAGLSLPLGQIGTGTARAEASAEGAIGFFFRPEAPSQSYAETLLKAITAIPEPLDLSEIRHAMTLAGLEGVVLGCRGGVETGLGLVLGEHVDIPKLAAGTAGLTADLSFQRIAQWVLSLRRVDGGTRFVLSRDRGSERKWAVGADIKLDVSPLARRVHDLLLEADRSLGPLLVQIKPFLSPGTYLATQAEELLEKTVASIVAQEDLREALIKDAAVALGRSDAASSAVVDLLRGRIVDLTAAGPKALLGDLDAWTHYVVVGLAAQCPGLAATGLPERLEERIRPLLKDVKDRFDALVARLTGDKSTSSDLAKELAALGADVRRNEDRADLLLKGVREVVAKFDDFSRRMLDATSDTAQARLEARFALTGDKSSGDNYELMGTIADDAAPEAAELWRALVTGRMRPFQQILAGTASAPSGFSLDKASSLTRFASSSSGVSFEVVLFGLDLSITSIVSGKASIVRNGAGDLLVAAEGSARRRLEGLHEERSISFVSGWDLVRARLEAGEPGRSAMSVGVTFDHDDRNLEPEEVEGLLSGLTSQKLIDPSRQAAAMELYQKWRVEAAAGAKVRGRIRVSMRLPEQAVLRMVAIGREISRGGKGSREAMFRLAVQAQLATGVATEKQLRSDVETIKRSHTLTGKSDDPIAYLLALWIFDPKSSSRDGTTYRAVDQVLPRAGAFVAMLSTMARIYDATPVLGKAAAAGEMDEEGYGRAEKELAAAARSWLALNSVLIVSFKARLHPALLAFFRLLALMGTPAEDLDGATTAGLEADPVTASTNALFVIAMSQEGGADPVPI